MTYILTFEYSDKSATKVCGVTESRTVAEAWYNANDETNVYAASTEWAPTRWIDGLKSWRQENEEREKYKAAGANPQTPSGTGVA